MPHSKHSQGFVWSGPRQTKHVGSQSFKVGAVGAIGKHPSLLIGLVDSPGTYVDGVQPAGKPPPLSIGSQPIELLPEPPKKLPTLQPMLLILQPIFSILQPILLTLQIMPRPPPICDSVLQPVILPANLAAPDAHFKPKQHGFPRWHTRLPTPQIMPKPPPILDSDLQPVT